MRYAALIFGLLGIGVTGFFAYRININYKEYKNDPQKFEFMVNVNRELAGTKTTVEDYRKQFDTLPYLLGGVAAGFIGCVVVMLRYGLVATILMVLAAISPAITYP